MRIREEDAFKKLEDIMCYGSALNALSHLLAPMTSDVMKHIGQSYHL